MSSGLKRALSEQNRDDVTKAVGTQEVDQVQELSMVMTMFLS